MTNPQIMTVRQMASVISQMVQRRLNFSSLFKFLSDHSWLVLILAALGGLVVFVGLILKYGEDAEHSNACALRRYKLKKKFGEIFVIAGVGLETIIAVALAGKDIWDNTKTASDIAKNDPRKQLARTVMGIADFKVSDPAPFVVGVRVMLTLGWYDTHFSSNELARTSKTLVGTTSFNWGGVISGRGVVSGVVPAEESGTNRLFLVSVFFSPSDPANFSNSGSPSVPIDKINAARLRFLARDEPLRVTGSGEIELVINSSINLGIGIPLQTNRGLTVSGARKHDAPKWNPETELYSPDFVWHPQHFEPIGEDLQNP